jgi:hypothetical protein
MGGKGCMKMLLKLRHGVTMGKREFIVALEASD